VDDEEEVARDITQKETLSLPLEIALFSGLVFLANVSSNRLARNVYFYTHFSLSLSLSRDFFTGIFRSD
jgi:hypothetical protein